MSAETGYTIALRTNDMTGVAETHQNMATAKKGLEAQEQTLDRSRKEVSGREEHD